MDGLVLRQTKPNGAVRPKQKSNLHFATIGAEDELRGATMLSELMVLAPEEVLIQEITASLCTSEEAPCEISLSGGGFCQMARLLPSTCWAVAEGLPLTFDCSVAPGGKIELNVDEILAPCLPFERSRRSPKEGGRVSYQIPLPTKDLHASRLDKIFPAGFRLRVAPTSQMEADDLQTAAAADGLTSVKIPTRRAIQQTLVPRGPMPSMDNLGPPGSWDAAFDLLEFLGELKLRALYSGTFAQEAVSQTSSTPPLHLVIFEGLFRTEDFNRVADLGRSGSLFFLIAQETPSLPIHDTHGPGQVVWWNDSKTEYHIRTEGVHAIL